MLAQSSSGSGVEELDSPVALGYSPSVLARRNRAAAEFIAWSDQRDHERRLQASRQAQLAAHQDQLDQRNALAQQLVWARKHAHLKALHASGMAQLRHP